MKKITVGICPSVLELLYTTYNEKMYIFSVIKQQKIAVCKSLIDYYIEHVPDEYKEFVSTFFDDIITSCDQSYPIKIEEGKDVITGLIEKLRGIKHSTYISDKPIDEKAFRGIEYLMPINIINQDDIYKNSYLYLCTVPLTNYFIAKDTPNPSIISWFEDLFYNEKHIIIQDEYVFNDNGLRALDKHYVNIFPSSLRKISIYGSLSASKQSKNAVIRHFSSSRYSGWELELYNCPEFHPRCIQTDNKTITLDAGIDFLGKHDETIRACMISISMGKAMSINGAEKIYEG